MRSDINVLLLVGAAVALFVITAGMVMRELAATRRGDHFFRSWSSRLAYWLTYFCTFVLGSTLLLKAILLFIT
jgi:hypothetical protein